MIKIAVWGRGRRFPRKLREMENKIQAHEMDGFISLANINEITEANTQPPNHPTTNHNPQSACSHHPSHITHTHPRYTMPCHATTTPTPSKQHPIKLIILPPQKPTRARDNRNQPTQPRLGHSQRHQIHPSARLDPPVLCKPMTACQLANVPPRA